jgi:tetratricopeptide (TPR) repeat protein
MKKSGGCVFLAYHFDKEGREYAGQLAWVLGLIDISVVFGEGLGGERVSDGVQRRIESADIVIVLLTGEPTHWIVQEIAWAVAKRVPCLIVVREGVVFDGRIAGDLEQIRFAPDEFAKALKQVVHQVQTLTSIGLDIPELLPGGPNRSDRVRLLIMKTREEAKQGHWEEVIRTADEALTLDPAAAEAAINKAVALVHLNELKNAERLLQRVLEDFPGIEDSLKSKAHFNLASIEEMRDAGNLAEASLRKQHDELEKSIALDHKNVFPRASQILCRVALKDYVGADSLLMDSIKLGPKFFKALRRLVETKGAEGHRQLSKLPDWVYWVVFPMYDEDDD